ncbi:cytochrome c oxidase assembly factor 6 [Lamellibrachia satsuma]|nr:cytochrome c oxidase assembly factor 6 [Lamellibrachia satsuma]
MAPSKAQRQKCWSARDAFWDCMGTNSNDCSKCTAPRTAFENSCSKSWVKYFDKRKDFLKYQEKIEKEGYEPIGNKQPNA